MLVVTFLMSKIASLITPVKHPASSPKVSPNRRFYKQSFMTDEIEALQSIFHSEEANRRRKNK